MQKKLSFLALCLFCLLNGVIAQVPMYFKSGGGTGTNTSPLNVASPRTQNLYRPSDFSTTPVSGYITKIYFRNATAAATGTYTNFEINFKQNTDTVFPSTTFYTGLTNAMPASTITLTGNPIGDDWFEIPMPTPYFLYDNTKTLIAEIKFTAKTGGITTNISSTGAGNKRCTAAMSTATTGTLSASAWNDFGMDISVPCSAPPTPGTATASRLTTCSGGTVALDLAGNSGGIGQTYQWQSATAVGGPYTNIGTSSTNSSRVINPVASLYYRATVTCGASSVNSTPVYVAIATGMSGTYTINPALPASSTNFTSIKNAADALCTITGPVIFNVAPGSGPYNEQVTIPYVNGMSATNTIRFNGNGVTLQAISTNGKRAIITLDSADYVTIDSLNIVGLDATYGYGIHLTNGADRNTISRCTINMLAVTSTVAANSGGIVGSGDATSTTVDGDASYNIINNNTIIGGYQGIILQGKTGVLGSVKNQITNNTVKDFYSVGIEFTESDSTLVENNNITRAARTAVGVFTGIEVGANCKKTIVRNNRVHDTHNTATTQSGTSYGIFANNSDAPVGAENLFVNNIIYNMNSGTGVQYGFYNAGAVGTIYYHNTVVLSNAASTAGTTRGFYQTTAATNITLKDNIFYVTRGGTGEKHCLYFGTTTSAITSNKNDLYINAPAGTNYIGSFGTTDFATLALWRTANGGFYDLQSDTLDPVFTSIPTGNLLPTSTILNNRGIPVGILTDITGAARSASLPDMGAFEFGIPPCDTPTNLTASAITPTAATLTWNGPTGAAGYEYVLNQTAANPSSGTAITATTYAASPLTPLTTYYMHVRTYCGVNYSDWVTISFTTPCAPPIAAITPAGPVTFCNGDSIVLRANTSAGLTYQWKNGTTNIAGATDTVYTVTTAGTYSLVTSLSTCSTTSAAVTVSVIARPDTAITMTPANGTACSGSPVALTVPSATGATYKWFLNNVEITGATSNTYAATAAGDYRVLVSNGSCADTSVAKTVTIIPTPTATITAPGATTICQGSGVTLNGSPSTAGLTYQWLLNSTPIAAATNATYNATAAGSYRLIISNGSCADTSSAITITVNPQPPATVTAAGPTGFCTGGSVVLNANTGTGLGYIWLRNNAPIVPAATGSSYTATTSGVYTVIVRYTSTGCSDTSDPGTPVAVSTPPATTLNFTGNLTFCQGGSVTFQAPTGTGFTYVWYKDASVIVGANTSSYIATIAGVYYAVVTNGPCSSTTVTRTVVVNPLPVATATPAGSTSFCSPGSVVINANTGTGLTYQWQLNTFNITGATASSYTATASGNYTVIVSNGTCSNTSALVLVNASTMPAPAIVPQGPTTFCLGNNVILETPANPGYTYQWRINSVNITGANNNTYTATTAGDYTVVVTNGSCVATSPAITTIVNSNPPANALPNGPTTFCEGEAVTLHGDIATGFTYQWKESGANIPGANNQTYIATTSGDYAVEISDGNCTSLSPEVTVTVHPVPAMPVITVVNGAQLSTSVAYITYQWYRNGNLIPGATNRDYTALQTGTYTVVVGNAYGCEATSVGQVVSSVGVATVGGAGKGIHIWPNPAAEILHVDAAQPVNISISGMDGKELMRSEKVSTIDITQLPQGFYMIRVTDTSSGTLMSIQKITKK